MEVFTFYGSRVLGWGIVSWLVYYSIGYWSILLGFCIVFAASLFTYWAMGPSSSKDQKELE